MPENPHRGSYLERPITEEGLIIDKTQNQDKPGDILSWL